MLMAVTVPSGAIDVTRQEALLEKSRAGSTDSSVWLSVSPDTAAQAWNLTISEWGEYQKLMQGPARHYAREMPPIMVLAMYADTDQERDRYAEMLAIFERDKADRILKVQRAYDAAMKRLFPHEKILDLELLRQQGMLPAVTRNNADDNRSPRLGDTLVLFATPECGHCAERIRTLVSRFSIAPLEVYFAGDSAAFKQWIQDSTLQPDWLKQHGVTFSKDEGQSEQYQAAPGTVFIVRDHALLEMEL